MGASPRSQGGPGIRWAKTDAAVDVARGLPGVSRRVSPAGGGTRLILSPQLRKSTMTRSINASITLLAVAASSLPGVASSYLITLISADPAVAPITAHAALDATSAVLADVPAGSYTSTIAIVDAAGNALAPAVAGSPSPLVVADVSVVMVNIPSALALSVAP